MPGHSKERNAGGEDRHGANITSEGRSEMGKCKGLLALTSVLILTLPLGADAQIFSEGFEGYAPSTYPSPPWTNMFGGQSGLVSTLQAETGSQSFRSESLPNWARWDYVTRTIADRVTYRASVYVETAGRGGAVGFGFVHPGVPNTGWWGNAAYFAGDGNIYFSTHTAGSTVVGTWSPGIWYTVEVQIDYLNLLAYVILDGAWVASDLPTDPKVLPASLYGVPIPLDQFGMFGANFPGSGTGVVYYDDLLVADGFPVPVENSSWGRIKALFGE